MSTESLAAQILPGLKDFQRASVEHAFNQLYDAPDSTGRFLVADEVGLGKTMVARGIIAKAIDRLRKQGVERIDVIYVCSNQVIARQNISKLDVTGARHGAVFDRVTMLPAHLAELAAHDVNLIPLTPQTSLDLRSSVGAARERAMLWHLLDHLYRDRGYPRYMTRKGSRRIIQGPCRDLDSIQRRINGLKDVDLNEDLVQRFLATLEKDEDERGDDSMLARFEWLSDEFVRRRKDEYVWDANQLIGELRRTLAKSCVDELEADVIILDEFQRFRNLLDPDHPESELSSLLFSQETAKVLMLSATPYKMHTHSVEAEEDHHTDFLATLKFLFGGDEQRVADCKWHLAELRSGLRQLPDVDGERRARDAKTALEQILRQVMSRTERLAVGTDRDGMIRRGEVRGLDLTADDVRGYAELDRIARAVDHPDPTEYWKSTPYPLNFMDDYKLSRKFEELAGTDADARAKTGTLNTSKVRGYEQVDFANPKLRALAKDTVERGMWKLLWLPPSLPYYMPGAPFDGELADIKPTKRLIFSAWNVVPKAVACMLSYEAERQLVGLDENDRQNTSESREAVSALLRFARTGPDNDRAGSMTTLALMYPSVALADLGDPLEIAREEGTSLGVRKVLRSVEARIRRLVDEVTAGASRFGSDDVTWYAVAPMLIDGLDGPDVKEWLRAGETGSAIGQRREQGETRDGDSNFVLHLRRALDAIRNGTLGKPPRDLTRMLALQAIGSPAVCAFRAIRRQAPDADVGELKRIALKIADGFRGTYNQPEIQPLIKATDRTLRYWEDALWYGAHGNLQAVLDEYAHVLLEWAPIEPDGENGAKSDDAKAKGIGEAMQEALSLRAPDYEVREIDGAGVPLEEPLRMRTRFALRFGDAKGSDDQQHVMRAGAVRIAFNSPFWPFILASTSVGQEGLDFHQYCHAVVHWNLPTNPVDFEQREGRVHRYKGHAVRLNVAESHQDAALASANGGDPWKAMFDDAPRGEGDLRPFWVYPDGNAKILRYIPILPWSRDTERRERLEKLLATYRLAFGQPRQDELLALLNDADLDPATIGELTIALNPGPSGSAV